MLRSIISLLTIIGKWLWNTVFVYIIRFLAFVLSRIIIVVGIVAGIVAVLSSTEPGTTNEVTVLYHADIDPMRTAPWHTTWDTNIATTWVDIQTGTSLTSPLSWSLFSWKTMTWSRSYDATLSWSILIIDINGIILGHKPPTITFWDFIMYQWVTFASDIVEQLSYAQTNDAITAVLIRINSPWWTVVGANMIAQAIKTLQETKPVLSFITETAASWWFWVVAGTDAIVAERWAQIGSIGVIMGPFVRYEEITAMDNIQAVASVNAKERIGWITVSYLTAGEGKDFGNPFRRMTDKERNIAQAGINNIYALFVAHVASGRNVSWTIVRNERWAYLYESMTAVRKWLIDLEGNLRTAVELIGKKTGIHPRHFTLLTRNHHTQGMIFQTLSHVLTRISNEPSRRTQLCHSHQSLVLPYTTMTTLCH